MYKILYFGDPGASFGETFETEAKYVKRYLKEFIFENKKFKFVSTIDSMKIIKDSYDILIFDFGGLSMGASDTVSSLCRHILKLVEERPNTLFVAWTSLTTIYLEGECKKEIGEYPNLLCRDTDQKDLVNAIKEWIEGEKE